MKWTGNVNWTSKKAEDARPAEWKGVSWMNYDHFLPPLNTPILYWAKGFGYPMVVVRMEFEITGRMRTSILGIPSYISFDQLTDLSPQDAATTMDVPEVGDEAWWMPLPAPPRDWEYDEVPPT